MGSIIKMLQQEIFQGDEKMEIRIGEKIKKLRKSKNISQEVLAQYLGISFQAVSKWEKGDTMPDVALIPAIASFFGVSTDELFDFNTYEIEKRVMEICWEAAEYRDTDPEKGEKILLEGLKQYPGNDIILNNLLYVMRAPERSSEVISLCKSLIESTKYDDVKYDALRIMAETYRDMGELSSAKEAIEQIPEIYFTRNELGAQLLEGKDKYHDAVIQKSLSAQMLVDMMLALAEVYIERGLYEKAKSELSMIERVVEAMKDDIPLDASDLEFGDFGTEYGRTFYMYYGGEITGKAKKLLEKMQ